MARRWALESWCSCAWKSSWGAANWRSSAPQLFSFFRQLQLPVSLEELGLAGASLQELQEVCRFACRDGSDLHHLPFPVSPDDLLSALVSSSQGCLTH